MLKPTLGNKLGTLFITFFVMLIVVGLCAGLLDDTSLGRRGVFLLTSSLQSVLVFIFPSWLAAYLCSGSALGYLGFETPVSLRQFLGVVVLLTLMTPAMNMIIEANAAIILPDSLSGLERVLRQWEDTAARTTEMILSGTGWGTLVSGVVIVGCLTGLSEELFFRGGIQRAMVSSGINVHLAVWTAAFIFSAVHFQFFGFIPRLLLGGCFGYLYSYTGSIWVSAFAHALNNSVVVVTSWLSCRGILGVEVDKIGTGSGEAIWIAAGSVIITALFIRIFGSILFRPRSIK